MESSFQLSRHAGLEPWLARLAGRLLAMAYMYMLAFAAATVHMAAAAKPPHVLIMLADGERAHHRRRRDCQARSHHTY